MVLHTLYINKKKSKVYHNALTLKDDFKKPTKQLSRLIYKKSIVKLYLNMEIKSFQNGD